MSIPNTLVHLTEYIDGLDSFPVDRTTSVRQGLSDFDKLPMVVIGDYKITPDQLTTDGPTVWISEFSINCFANTQAAAFTLATAVDELFSQQQITENTSLCELVNVVVVQLPNYRFQAQLNYKLHEDA